MASPTSALADVPLAGVPQRPEPGGAGAAGLQWAAEDLWLSLQALLPDISVEVLPSTPSTNTLLLERARKGADIQPCLLVAETQTAGRGRQGRPWYSQAGASLCFSLALPLAPADWAGLSLAVGLAVADALDPVAAGPARIGLKWPNDLWLMDGSGGPARHGRKLGGILIETLSVGGQRIAVVGVGLNVAPQVLATASLSQGQAWLQELEPGLSAPQALGRVAVPLLRSVLRFQTAGFAPLVAGYARRDVLRGAEVSTSAVDVPSGLAVGVDEQGALLVQGLEGVQGRRLQRVLSGEVSVRPRSLALTDRSGGP